MLQLNFQLSVKCCFLQIVQIKDAFMSKFSTVLLSPLVGESDVLFQICIDLIESTRFVYRCFFRLKSHLFTLIIRKDFRYFTNNDQLNSPFLCI